MDKLIDLLIIRMITEYKNKDRSGVYGYTQRNLAYNSNKIEGSGLSQKQTENLFDTFNAGNFKLDNSIIVPKDVEETTGHFIMFNNMLKTFDLPLSEKLIKGYHSDLKSGVFEDFANGYAVGEYKTKENFIDKYETSKPENVHRDIVSLLNAYNPNRKNHTLEELAIFHAKYEQIHPFQDGNGRTGRIILFKECLNNKIFPFIIEDTDKFLYYDALTSIRENNDYNKLIKLFEISQVKYFNFIKNYVIDASIEEINRNI